MCTKDKSELVFIVLRMLEHIHSKVAKIYLKEIELKSNKKMRDINKNMVVLRAMLKASLKEEKTTPKFIKYNLNLIKKIIGSKDFCNEHTVQENKFFKYIAKQLGIGFKLDEQVEICYWRRKSRKEKRRAFKRNLKNNTKIYKKDSKIQKQLSYPSNPSTKIKLEMEIQKGWLQPVSKGELTKGKNKKIQKIAPMFGLIEMRKQIKKIRILTDARILNDGFKAKQKINMDDIDDLICLYKIKSYKFPLEKNQLIKMLICISTDKKSREVNPDMLEKIKLLKEVIDVNEKDLWILAIDLEDAYRQILAATSISSWRNIGQSPTFYKNRTLPQGTAASVAALQATTTLLSAILSYFLRVQFLVYLDDIYTLSNNHLVYKYTKEIILALGFKPNETKSSFSKTSEILGFDIKIDNKQISLFNKSNREEKISQLVSGNLTYKDFLSIRGIISFSDMYKIRPQELTTIYKINEKEWEEWDKEIVTSMIKKIWQQMPLTKIVKPKSTKNVEIIYSDASMEAGGIVEIIDPTKDHDLLSNGRYLRYNFKFSNENKNLFNIRDLEAIMVGETLKRVKNHSLVIIRCDNQNVVKNTEGRCFKPTSTTHRKILEKLVKIQNDKNLEYKLIYINTKDNIADIPTRTKSMVEIKKRGITPMEVNLTMEQWLV